MTRATALKLKSDGVWLAGLHGKVCPAGIDILDAPSAIWFGEWFSWLLDCISCWSRKSAVAKIGIGSEWWLRGS